MAWVVARPRAALVGLGLVVLISLLAATRLGVDSDSSGMLSPELPAQQRAAALNAAFPGLKNNLAIVVRGETPDEADMAASALVDALSVEDRWIGPVLAPSTDPFLAAHGFLHRDLDEVETLFGRLSKSSNLIARLRTERTVPAFAQALEEAARLADGAEIAPEALELLHAETAAVLESRARGEDRPFSWSTVLDPAAASGPTTRVIGVTPRLDPSRLKSAGPALAAIEAAISGLPPDLAARTQIGVTGEPALRAEELDSVLETIGASLAMSLILVAIILRVGLGSTGRAALAFGSLLVALAITTGFAGIAVGRLNLISVAFIVLMVGLGIDFAIHILARVVEVRGTGASATEAVVATGRRSGLALALSAATTSLAFLAFATTDFAGMAQLGLIGGFGVLVAFAVAATLVPAVVALAPRIAGGPTDAAVRATEERREGTGVAVAVLLLGVAAILPATQARFDADPMGLRDPAAASVRAYDRIAAGTDATPHRISVVTGSRADAEARAERLEGAPGIGSAIWIGDLVPEDQDDKLAFLDFAAPSIEHAIGGSPTELSIRLDGDPVARLATRLRERDEAAASRLASALEDHLARRDAGADAALSEALFRTFPLMLERLEALLSADRVTEDTLPALLRERFVSADGLHRIEVTPETPTTTPDQVIAFADLVAEIDSEAAGGPAQLAAAGRSVGRAMMQAIALAALATLLLAYAATRRIVETVAITIPLALAGVLTTAASVLLDMPFNYANVIVLPLLIGIGVDSGIHMALRERRAPGRVYATSTPRAVLVSALTTMAAFGTLALSDHRGTASMGVLLAVSMMAATGSILALTPALIRWLRRDAADG